MTFDPPLLKGRLLRRYQRFFADVALDSGEVITAHTPNTGSLLTCTEPGSEAYVSPADNPKRTLKYTWELVRSGRALVGVHTGRANGLAEEAIRAGVIAELAGYGSLRREVRYGTNSRIDLLLEDEARPRCYVEVKNVTLARDGMAAFPDAVTERGAKHLRELATQVRKGARAVMLFIVQRGDCEAMTPADDIDPRYGRLLRQASRKGVEALAYRVRVRPTGLPVEAPLPIRF
ncbi:MAG: DNA/RNA nuclease SfsA [Candidatus Lambdaproteobacteria bacterium]|nr:DNA/RNA nuclease SfsA [Candidatus Lambdaproteobacteria bacterium]